jgi:DNA-binding transcriptional regulator YdaS (Cro superfamily)
LLSEEFNIRVVRPTEKHVEKIKEVIKHFGTQHLMAEAMGIVSSNISHWKNGKVIIPLEQAEKIQQITDRKFLVIDLRPDLLNYVKYFM